MFCVAELLWGKMNKNASGERYRLRGVVVNLVSSVIVTPRPVPRTPSSDRTTVSVFALTASSKDELVLFSKIFRRVHEAGVTHRSGVGIPDLLSSRILNVLMALKFGRHP